MSWRAIQKTNIRKLSELEKFLGIVLEEGSDFPLNIPLRLAQKMEPSYDDPILLQFVSRELEKSQMAGFTTDPVGDCDANKVGGLLHKYHGRALLVTTGACAMHCRYCFRQNFDYAPTDFADELDYIRLNPTIHEVILSGGDPLSLPDRRLIPLLEALDQIPHIQLIRFHSRFPIGIPERITTNLIDAIAGLHAQAIFISHINHPRELDQDVAHALQSLKVPLLNQSVLLKGVNDDYTTLKNLSLKLVTSGIMPYYLHQLDRVMGAAHFEVELERGLALIEEMRQTLPGYCVPKYVREIAGERAKTPLHAGQRL